MKGIDYWRGLYGLRSEDFVEGVKAGIEACAHSYDGTLYIGTTGKTLEEACREVDEAFRTEKGG